MKYIGGWVALGLMVIIVIIALMFAGPHYSVWSQEMKGRAEYARAEQNKQIMLIEAQQQLEVEKINAEIEVTRATGMAEAIAIEGGALTSQYIQYLWVRQNTFNDKTVIYIPTEANLPVLEAGKRGE